MTISDEQERLLQGPRRALERVRQARAAQTDLAFAAAPRGDGRMADRNHAARFAVLWALQYDRHDQDLPLLRFLLEQEIVCYRETVSTGLASDLTLAGFLVAEHRQLHDIWLHWDAKNISFDTALGYDLFHLLTPGIAATIEAVRASTHPDRDRLLDSIKPHHTDAAVEDWLAHQRLLFPADPADETLQTWAYHAARIGEPDASRRFITAWAQDQPHTYRTLNTLQYHLAGLGFLDEAIETQQQAVEICPDPPDSLKASSLLTLSRLQQQAGDFTAARHSLHDADQVLAQIPDWPWMGMWISVTKEYFNLVPLAPDRQTAQSLLDDADQRLRNAPHNWRGGVLDAAITAAQHLMDIDRHTHYQTLQEARRRELEQQRSPRPEQTP